MNTLRGRTRFAGHAPWRSGARALLLIATLGLALVAPVRPAEAAATGGPPLTVPDSRAAAALSCSGGGGATGPTPILLLHGTTSDPRADWAWNWVRALDARRWPHCELALPDSGNADIQVAGEYVVRAIRAMSARAGGRRIDIVGHSQGGMIGRFALKYWPDTRGEVDDLVSLAGSNHGTDVFATLCSTPAGCSAANWQQRRDSAFLTALNRGPQTWPGVSYTQIATATDEVVVPFTSSYLPAAPGDGQVTNQTVQQLCPTEPVDHFLMSANNGAWLIALDALTHPGPARLDRVSRSTCARPLMPGVDPLAFPTDAAAAVAQTAASSATTPKLPAEPPLAPYVR